MLKSCKYCGRIHDSKIDCGKKPNKIDTMVNRFRWSKAWKHKREDIKERDKYMCQICLRKLYDIGTRQYNGNDLEVHHIVPLSADFDKRLEDDNLLTCCRGHHELAESKQIPIKVLISIAKEQNDTPRPY